MKIPVTQPTMPPFEEFIPYLRVIWESKTLTNGGPLHQRLEKELSSFLGVEHLSLVANATLGLLTSFQALGIRDGEVITTPYSFVATSNVLHWLGLSPVFADIDPRTLNINPISIEQLITEKTRAILAVHCYGFPCDVEAIERLAQKYSLKVIYDAAHAFGVNCHCGSILLHGNASVLSFHATKVFNTFEGGAIISPNKEQKEHIDNLKNFGFVDEVTVVAPGINSKMSEIHAAFGLLQLRHVVDSIKKRKIINDIYLEYFGKVAGLRCINEGRSDRINFSYFPILVDPQFPMSRDALYEELKSNGVYARRYFYPLISNFEMYSSLASASREKLPVANEIANQILCLPIYPDLSLFEQKNIIKIISDVSSGRR